MICRGDEATFAVRSSKYLSTRWRSCGDGRGRASLLSGTMITVTQPVWYLPLSSKVGRHLARAIACEACFASHSKSSAAMARPRFLRTCGPRSRAFSIGSVSEPPPEASGFEALSTNGIVDRKDLISVAATLPRDPPPERYVALILSLPIGGTWPRFAPLPNVTRPKVRSIAYTRSADFAWVRSSIASHRIRNSVILSSASFLILISRSFRSVRDLRSVSVSVASSLTQIDSSMTGDLVSLNS